MTERTETMHENADHLIAIAYGLPFVWIGVQHFLDPDWFEPIVPSSLGNPTFWVYLSGAFEITLGLGVALPWFRKEATMGIAVMLVALYWANLNMWINDIPIGDTRLSQRGHIIRGAVQLTLIIAALWIGGWIGPKSRGI